ncbi:hypothetical protein PBI_FLOOF_55 [Microbacterium phage Floof]|uniref:Uncharacterized protein n=1 Tax=Microbacterium phage Floof TaxID=2201433 RepID=A0A2Z4Q4C1_9CAUD|nr:hypothetical protein PBI_FLOOF_55 [Microbacterium phage Floof]
MSTATATITTAATLTPGTTVLLWDGAAKVQRTVASVIDTVDRATLTLLQVTVLWTDGGRTDYVPDAEFTTI